MSHLTLLISNGSSQMDLLVMAVIIIQVPSLRATRAPDLRVNCY